MEEDEGRLGDDVGAYGNSVIMIVVLRGEWYDDDDDGGGGGRTCSHDMHSG